MRSIRFAAAALIFVASSGGVELVRAQDAHPTFAVGSATASRGARAAGVIRVPAGVDAGYEIPVMVIHGANPGPVLAVVAGSHGTEYASILAVEMMMGTEAPSAVDP